MLKDHKKVKLKASTLESNLGISSKLKLQIPGNPAITTVLLLGLP